MQGIDSHSIHFKDFNPTAAEPLLGLKSVVFLGYNILTLGIYAAVTTLSKEHHIRHLKLVQEDLQDQFLEMRTSWDDLEKSLSEILAQINGNEKDSESIEAFQRRLNKLSVKATQLQGKPLKFNIEVTTTIAEVALGTIAFVGKLIANILTLGLYGVYQNNTLKNRIHVLEEQNNYIHDQFDSLNEDKLKNLQKIIDSGMDLITAKSQLEGLENTDTGKAYLEIKKAQAEVANLKKKQATLQQDLSAVKVEKLAAEKGKKSVEDELKQRKIELDVERRRNNKLADDERRLNQENQRMRQDNAKKDSDLQRQQQKAKTDLADLQVKFNGIKAKAEKVDQLENQIKKIQLTQTHQPEVVKLASQLGPIPPKYQARSQDKEVKGAMDIDDMDVDDMDDLDPVDEMFFKEYNKRYGKMKAATDVAVVSFNHACEQLLEMADTGNKIKLNRSGDNSSSNIGMSVIYRYMALDILKGAKIASNGCHGLKLSINSNLAMLPSKPERILQYKPDVSVGLKPVVEVHYKQRDDFTPDEETLGLRDGLDPISAKWILEQLSDEEMEYLFTHLMAPMIENTHPDYIKMRAFMQNNDARVKLVETASELIQDMATAFQKKFGGSVLIDSYNEHFDDWDIDPFVKKEDDVKDLKKIANDLAEITTGPKVVDWVLDEDVIGDKRQYDTNPRQKDFYNLVLNSHKKYQSIFAVMEQDLLRYPQTPGKEYKRLEWKDLNQQYHIAHQMIGADFNGDGGERCLFSNLLAVLVTDKSQLTSQNVQKLKNAMAQYLDKLKKAHAQWSIDKNRAPHLQTKDAAKNKELADLYMSFEQAIKKTHNCTLTAYQAWLRGDAFGGAPINVGNLTPFEIQLAAFTIGVRIGLLPIMMNMVTKVNDSGQILPEGDIFGPNTQELLVMGVWDPLDGKGGTYYSLFPKINLDNEDLQASNAFDAAIDVENYWKSIPMKE